MLGSSPGVGGLEEACDPEPRRFFDLDKAAFS